jgi:hypothetical protein
MVTSDERKRLERERYADGLGIVLRCAAGLTLLVATAYIGVNADFASGSRSIAKPAIAGEMEVARVDLPATAAEAASHSSGRATD